MGVGRKPHPTKLKILKGNPGNRKLNRNEPQPKEDLFSCPEWFDNEHQASWKYAIDHAPAGVLGSIDRDILAVWVVANVLHSTATIQQAKIDAGASLPLITKTPAGNAVVSPYVKIINQQATIMLKAASEMGFTPSSRTRLTVQQKTDSDNPFARYGDS